MAQGWIRGLLLVILLGALLGCSRLTPHELDQNDIEHAEQLMAQGQTAESERILLRLHQQQPHWPRPRLLLAALEMSKVDFDATSLFPLIRTFVDVEDKPTLPRGASRTRRTLADLRRLLETIDLIVERFEKIPTVSQGQLLYLEKAIDWIAPIESPSPGQALFRATLRIMAIKSRGVELFASTGGHFSKMICDWKGQDFLDWVSKETKQVELSGHDLSIAFPESSASIDQLLLQLRNILAPPKSNSLPSVKTIREILEERMFELGLEELSPCA